MSCESATPRDKSDRTPYFTALARHIGETMQALSRRESSGGRRSIRLHHGMSHDTRGRTVTFCAKNDVGGMEALSESLVPSAGPCARTRARMARDSAATFREVNLYPFWAISDRGTVYRANSRAQRANGLAWSDVDHLRRSEGKFSWRAIMGALRSAEASRRRPVNRPPPPGGDSSGGAAGFDKRCVRSENGCGAV